MRTTLSSRNAIQARAAGSAASGTLPEMADSDREEAALQLIPVPAIQQRIMLVRERQVMLDEDLAELYGVETGALTRAVRRNKDRFPDDFMFQLTKDEWAA